MRKVFYFFMLISASVGFVSCEGDQGPPGPQGPAGDTLIGTVFEYNITFSAANNFEEFRDFPSSLDVYDTDVVLAYILNTVDNGLDVWEPLPQTIYFQDGILMTGFDHTYVDIRFFLDGTVDFDNLDPDLTNDLVMRVAVLPADALSEVNTNDYNEVMNAISKKNIEVQTIELK